MCSPASFIDDSTMYLGMPLVGLFSTSLKIIAWYLCVIKYNHGRKGIFTENACAPRIISGCEHPPEGPCDIYHRDVVLSRIALGVAVRMELTNQLHVERGFLLCFSNCGCFECFSVIDESAWRRPAMWRVFPLDHHNALIARLALELEDDVHHKIRVSGGLHLFARFFVK